MRSTLASTLIPIWRKGGRSRKQNVQRDELRGEQSRRRCSPLPPRGTGGLRVSLPSFNNMAVFRLLKLPAQGHNRSGCSARIWEKQRRFAGAPQSGRCPAANSAGCSTYMPRRRRSSTLGYRAWPMLRLPTRTPHSHAIGRAASKPRSFAAIFVRTSTSTLNNTAAVCNCPSLWICAAGREAVFSILPDCLDKPFANDRLTASIALRNRC